MMRCGVIGAAILVGIRWISPSPVQAQHDVDIWVGRTSTGQLNIGGADISQLIPLIPTSGLINGWADNDPGFDRVITSQPANNLFPLAGGAQISLRLVFADPAFRAIDNSFFILELPGDETYLGNAQLHTHLTWHVNADDPNFDPLRCRWNATFILIDDGSTNYRDSAPFTLMFTLAFSGQADGDFNANGYVDLEDTGLFADCMTGPRPPGAPACRSVCLGVFDFDADDDLDLHDLARLQRTFLGG